MEPPADDAQVATDETVEEESLVPETPKVEMSQERMEELQVRHVL